MLLKIETFKHIDSMLLKIETNKTSGFFTVKKIFDVNILFSMTRVIHYICNIKIMDFLLCQYVIYGPRKKSIIV